ASNAPSAPRPRTRQQRGRSLRRTFPWGARLYAGRPSRSPFSPPTNAAKAGAGTERVARAGYLESRMAMRRPAASAISTQSFPSPPPEKDALRQRVGSVIGSSHLLGHLVDEVARPFR